MARREADAARNVLAADVRAVRHALTPAVIADRVSVKAATAIESANSEIRARPGAAAAGLAAVLLFAARHRLLRRREAPKPEDQLSQEFPTISRQDAAKQGI
ncbi:hypothetical protein [Sphingomonas qomolangmaensis]|uniref:DUF3618 domain-containing protein n=1 Tax=Sphingomonas qomolangmaensis TaxID=2918765 RepID=A0ABY5LA71_9SPHN|nr:hypothetical protein [Sphingomonas qomolangmaensis]UUL83332.1 hypothetical protein NMP03_03615 [Sphingomonas qomolangmaensis]